MDSYKQEQRKHWMKLTKEIKTLETEILKEDDIDRHRTLGNQLKKRQNKKTHRR